MRSSELLLAAPVLALIAGCGGSEPASASAPVAAPVTHALADAVNVLPVTVNGSLCSQDSYSNKPCVQITICVPGTATCQVVDDVLLDTGSYGVRIFKQAIDGLPLQPLSLGSGSLAECVAFGDGSTEWGPVAVASVILGGEPTVDVPIQVIDYTFGAAPSGCAGAQQSPADPKFNGILGVGVFAQDCGAPCARSPDNGLYYTCSGVSCIGAAPPIASQVQNPVALLPQDNNGVVVQLPRLFEGGAPWAEGHLVLGIGTRPNNVPSGATSFSVDRYGNLSTILGGVTYRSFVDTGSNGLFFTPPPSSPLPYCPSPASPWYCPSVRTGFTATNADAAGAVTGTVPFQIDDFLEFASSLNRASAEIAGNGGPAGAFDWGLPFFFGRGVYVGLEGTSSSLGTGPYVAY